MYTTGNPYKGCDQELETFGAGALVLIGWMLSAAAPVAAAAAPVAAIGAIG